jgi:hypothetical protein
MDSVKEESVSFEEIEGKLKEFRQWIDDEPEIPKTFGEFYRLFK